MRLADKLARDEAKHLKDMFEHFYIGQEKADVKILERNHMYKFFLNKGTLDNPYNVKNTTIERDKLIYKITLEKYLKFKVITHEEFKSLILQIQDPEAIFLVEGLIEHNLRPKWKRKEKTLNKEELLTYKFKKHDTDNSIITDNNK